MIYISKGEYLVGFIKFLLYLTATTQKKHIRTDLSYILQ